MVAHSGPVRARSLGAKNTASSGGAVSKHILLLRKEENGIATTDTIYR